MVKKVVKYLFWGIAWGCTFFVLVCLTGALTVGDAFIGPVMANFIKQAMGAILVGIFCGSSSIVYTFEKMPMGLRIAIHATVGLTGYFFIAYWLGWMPIQNGWQIASFIGLGLLLHVL